MKVGVVGSRSKTVQNLEDYLPKGISEIVSGGAKGIDLCAKQYAIKNNIKLVEFLPNYARYGRGAPIKRNNQIVDYCDVIIAFWDGVSKGTKYTIDFAKSKNKKVVVIFLE